MDLHAKSDSPADMTEAASWAAAKLLGTPGGDFDGKAPFSFTYNGKPSSDFLGAWTVKRTAQQLDAQRTQHTVTYSDPATGLEVRCVAVQYGDFPTVEWTVYFKNTGQTDSPILEKIQALDSEFRLGNRSFELLHFFDGGYASPNAYQPHEVALSAENTHQTFDSGGRGSDRYLPYFNLEYGDGGVIIAIGWPGHWKAEFTDSRDWGRRVCAGQLLTHFRLHPGEEVRSPLVALQFWKKGDWIDAQNVWRRWMIAHSTPTHDGKPLPSQLAGCSSHLFGEMIRANEENQKFFVDGYVANGIKIDYWWMDAGWYPNNGRWDNTGTWEVDLKRFPNGLRAITDNAHAKGVKSIVWFEPERVTPGTWLWEKHPEWLLGGDEKNRLLNLGNPKAWQWLTDHVDHLINEQGIDLYRQDYNINPSAIWRESDAPDRQGITEIRYNEGYLAYWDELRRRHPGMLIDSCSSGGRRNDLETLRRSVPLLRSDDIGQPVDNQGHTYGMALWIPYAGTGAPVDAYSFRSAMGWHLTIGPDVRKADTDYAEYRRLVGQWRQVSPNFLGDFYPLMPYSLSNNAWMAWQYNRPENGGGIVQAFRRVGCAASTDHFKLRGLQSDARYRLTDLDNLESKTEMTGKELMEGGLPVALPSSPSAAVIQYERIAN